MKRIVRIVSALLLVLAAAGPGRAVPLADLLDGTVDYLDVGDKRFDNWQFLGQGLMDSTGQVDLANIEVTGLDDDPLNPGLLFDAGGELAVSGDNFIDLYFGFSVTAPAATIKDVSFSFNSGSWGGDGFGAGYETVLDAAGAQLALLSLEASDVRFEVSARADFARQREIWVEKNILLYGFADGDSASLNSFTQRFSQVPEPGTAVLLGSGLLGAALVRRKKK